MRVRERGGIRLTAAAKYLSTMLPALKALNDGRATDGGRRWCRRARNFAKDGALPSYKA
jgi:hypothetical protein